MNKLTLTAAALLTALFPKSQKAISEGLSTEDFNAFSGELVEVGTRMNTQTEGNEKLKTDYEAAVKRADTAEASLKKTQEEVSTLKASLAKAEGDRDTFKDHYDAQVAAGKGLPKEDANSRQTKDLPANDPTQAALDAWNKANPAPAKQK